MLYTCKYLVEIAIPSREGLGGWTFDYKHESNVLIAEAESEDEVINKFDSYVLNLIDMNKDNFEEQWTVVIAKVLDFVPCIFNGTPAFNYTHEIWTKRYNCTRGN